MRALLAILLCPAVALAQQAVQVCDKAGHCADVTSGGLIQVIGNGTAGSPGTAVLTVQGVSGGTAIPVSLAAGAVSDTTGTLVALSEADEACSVALAGQASASMFLAAGTLAATLTPELSVDGGGTWIATTFVSVDATVAATLVLTNPNAATTRGLALMSGTTHVRVRVSAFTSGAANCQLRATHVPPTTVIVSGGVAAGAAVAGNPVLLGGRADTTVPTAVTDGQLANVFLDPTGAVMQKSLGTSTLDTGLAATGCVDVVATAGGTAVLAAYSLRRHLFLQNQSTVQVYCMLGDTPTTTEYHFNLRAGTAADDSLGTSFSADNWTGAVTCIAASDPGTVNVCGVAY